ncbi:Scaffold-type E3 ligase [Colletotrichum fioriniae]|uniref:Scaffold-type E3 ligase n=1 Tax=Colletotrichum fioriniae TaxID=710243 RepID=UPI0032DAD9DD|nr:Scaffold-type E3 ligase [Colletotrichum fioriniae]
MAPTSTSQKAMTTQFVQLTGASDRTAQRYLKNAGYKLNEAVDAYFSGGSGTSTPTTSALDTSLNQMFDKLRDDSKDEKNTLGLDTTMAYLGDLGVNIENAELLVVMELLQAPSVGEITRKGFVDGWKASGAATRQAHVSHIKSLVSSLSTDPAYFRKVYRHTFVASKEPTQKALNLEIATVYWNVLFSPPGWEWKTKNQDWLQLWLKFLEEKWTRSVNRDMWNQILEFATKSMADETLSFWNEDGAWPSVIDDFVAWCKERGIGKSETMDLDA